MITINHNLLCSLGVGHSSLSEVVNASEAADFTCKLTGAGGGGCAITFINHVKARSVDVLQLEEAIASLTEILRYNDSFCFIC
jgi:mevalonate kinase